MSEDILKELLFPFSKVRNVQSDMITDVYSALKDRKDMILHAPTGIGKTVSVLAPALAHSINNGLTVFFLTSRQTQHRIAVETLKEIKRVHKLSFGVSDIIGKKGMCIQTGIANMFLSDFHEYCRSLREEEKCEYYINTRNKNFTPTIKAKQALENFKVSPCNAEEFIKTGEKERLCPYELAVLNAADAKVIIADYYYIFNEYIRNSFLLKVKKNLEKSIIIVDEAHNLPMRIRDLMTERVSSFTIEMALKEAKRLGYSETAHNLQIIGNALQALSSNLMDKSEGLVDRKDFISAILKEKDYDTLTAELIFIGEEIRNEKKRSFVLSVGKFMSAWLEHNEGFSRIIRKDSNILLLLRCLDPSISTKGVVNNSYSTILMSGTLTPTYMYKDTLGFPADTIEKEYASPFPNKNRLVCVLPKTTTKFSKRNLEQFKQIACKCADILAKVKGCSIVFFPSYNILRAVSEYFSKISPKVVFTEKQRLTKGQKEDFLMNFKMRKDAVLFAVSSGSFGEGIDLPGLLKCIIVVGLPLQKPDLEIRELIKYYEHKFGNGWDYGYVLPAITKCMQNAGRCIRSETDKGVIVFLDERYAWSNYFRCFPKEWDVKVKEDISDMVNGFFI